MVGAESTICQLWCNPQQLFLESSLYCSGTPLILSTMGPSSMSWLARCPHSGENTKLGLDHIFWLLVLGQRMINGLMVGQEIDGLENWPDAPAEHMLWLYCVAPYPRQLFTWATTSLEPDPSHGEEEGSGRAKGLGTCLHSSCPQARMLTWPIRIVNCIVFLQASSVANDCRYSNWQGYPILYSKCLTKVEGSNELVDRDYV